MIKNKQDTGLGVVRIRDASTLREASRAETKGTNQMKMSWPGFSFIVLFLFYFPLASVKPHPNILSLCHLCHIVKAVVC